MKIQYYSDLYNVPFVVMDNVVRCESGYNPEAEGDKGNSIGLSQINLPSHLSVSKEEAQDIDFALKFMAENISMGNGDHWTCFRTMSLSEYLRDQKNKMLTDL